MALVVFCNYVGRHTYQSCQKLAAFGQALEYGLYRRFGHSSPDLCIEISRKGSRQVDRCIACNNE